MATIRLSVLLLLACACSARAQDAMTLPATCSDEPPPWSGSPPRLPRALTPHPGTASLIGTVRDRRTNRPLAGGLVRVRSQESLERATGVDSVGGFVIRDVPAGTYMVVTAAIPYMRQERTVKLRAGQVDTLTIALAYHSCSGY